jgi:hypothetical protein
MLPSPPRAAARLLLEVIGKLIDDRFHDVDR